MYFVSSTKMHLQHNYNNCDQDQIHQFT